MLDKDTLFYSTMDLIGRKGTKFTMDEVARNLGISKRTLYENILSKEALSIFMVNPLF
jgi:AcrR family transcriptional regulator